MLAMLCFAVPLTHDMLRLTLQDAQQEAADLQQDLVYNNTVYEEAAQWSVEDPQATEDADTACMDLQQQLSDVYAAHEAEKQEAEREAASLKQQLQAAQWSVEDQQAREDAEKVCTDLKQQLSDAYAAQEAEKREADRELAPLKQQLEQASVAQNIAVAALQQESNQAEVQVMTLIQVGLYY